MMQRISIRAAATLSAIAGAAAFLAQTTTAQAPQSPDQVAASFERELLHEPGPATRIHRDAVEHDELYEALNRVHWTRGTPSTAEQPAPPIPTEGDSNEKAYD